jgi:RNA polymerase sigma-70 factor (ECF subfamily)
VSREGSGDGVDLIRRFREGDEDAFRTLFERYGKVLSARIRESLPKRLRRKVAVSDVLQESLLVAFRKKEDFEDRGEAAFRHWLLNIVELRAREAIRRHDGVAKRSAKREVTRGERGPTANVPGKQPSPSQLAIGQELGALAKQALASLPEDYREILRLTREQKLSLAEASERIERSEAATRKLYGRALERFRVTFDRLKGDCLG